MSAAQFFDTHTHLNDSQFDPDRGDILRLCVEGGIKKIVEIADAPADWDRAIALSRARPDMVRCSLGIHPYYAADYNDSIAALLPQKARLPEVVAVGEIGLDYVKAEVGQEIQKQSFLKMLDLAELCGLPTVIHCRGAYPDMMKILQDFYGSSGSSSPGGRGKGEGRRFLGVLHCFSGEKDDAVKAVGLGFALGVDGPITYPKNNSLREAIFAAGLDHIVLETDSPYLPPQSSRGKRNDPRAIPEIAQKIAQIFNVSVEEVARRTALNAEDLFRKAIPI